MNHTFVQSFCASVLLLVGSCDTAEEGQASGAACLPANDAPPSDQPIIALNRPEDQKLVNVDTEIVTWKGREALRVTDVAPPETGDGGRLVILTKVELRDGTIELDLTGDIGPNAIPEARGFVGVAFHVASAGTAFECFYLRPANGRADDQVRRNHSAQYISVPDFPFFRLREEFPEMYESYVDLIPGEWTRVKIEVSGTTARLFVHGAAQPTLIVHDLKLGEGAGSVALWVGPGTVAHFADLRVTASK